MRETLIVVCVFCAATADYYDDFKPDDLSLDFDSIYKESEYRKPPLPVPAPQPSDPRLPRPPPLRRPPPYPEDERYIIVYDGPSRQNDKFSSNSYPYVRGPGDREKNDGNNIRDDYPDERVQNYPRRCAERLEDALEEMRRKELAKKQSIPLKGYSLHQTLKTEPVDMYVTDIRVRMPSQIKVDNCLYHPRNNSLDTSLLFNDLTITGKVNLFGEGDVQREPYQRDRDACNMILRLRRAGIGFYTEPIRPPRERGQFNVRTDSHFLEPGFISVYAYGCEPRLREHRREYREEDDEEISREIEDIFLKGIRSLLTSYMQRQLQPAIKETLMTNMGYTVSYG